MKVGKYFSIERRYPVSLLLRFMEDTGYALRGHCVQLGPFALMLVWRQKEQEATNETGD